MGICRHNRKNREIALPERCQHFVTWRRLSRLNLPDSNRCEDQKSSRNSNDGTSRSHVASNWEATPTSTGTYSRPFLHQPHPENAYPAVSCSIKQWRWVAEHINIQPRRPSSVSRTGQPYLPGSCNF